MENYTKNRRIRVVFYGDSRAGSWPGIDHDDYEFINRGIGGETSFQVLQRFDQHIRPLQPQIIICQVGINDLTTIPLCPDQKENVILKLQANIKEIVEKSIAQGSTMILTTIFPIGEVPVELKLFWSDDVGFAINEVNEFISSLASENVVIFDTYSLLVGRNRVIKHEYSEDLLHLNEAGYELLNDEIGKIMMNLNER